MSRPPANRWNIRPLARTASTYGRRSPGKAASWSLLVLLPIVAVVVALALEVQDTLQEPRTVDLCQAGSGDATGHGVFLLDLQKPLARGHAPLPGRLLRDVTLDLAAHTELEVFTLTDYAEAPRMLLGRLCKPYGNADLAVDTAKDQGEATRDCDDLPAQIPATVRESAELFCAEREALVGRIDALVRASRSGLVRNAYLVEALEETARDFDRLRGAKSLYVFSDMMQHARWFSHLDTGWGGWDFEAFAARRDERAVLAGASPAPGPDWYTRIFYLHRKDVTERPEAQQAHRQFWERYFNERGLAEPQLAASRLHFEAQAPVLDYAAESLMAVPTQAELVAQERERVRYERVALEDARRTGERAALERMRDELESSRAALEAGRERLAAQRQQWQAREAELARGRARLKERETELVSERERLQALAVAAAAGDTQPPVNAGGP